MIALLERLALRVTKAIFPPMECDDPEQVERRLRDVEERQRRIRAEARVWRGLG